MSINEGAKIVPLNVANSLILDQDYLAPDVKLVDGYDRLQLLTPSSLKELVFQSHDRSYIEYADLSYDFPICSDYSDICRTDVKRESIKLGLAVRPAWGEVYYTQTSLNVKTGNYNRHAINFGILSTGRIIYYEPQTDLYLSVPKELQTLDEFKI